jgi:hypothetical protein
METDRQGFVRPPMYEICACAFDYTGEVVSSKEEKRLFSTFVADAYPLFRSWTQQGAMRTRT